MKIRSLALVALLVLALSGSALAGELKINGSTTVFPIMQKAVEAYMAKNPGTKISLSGGGSGNGIKALIDSTADICMSSRDMKDKEIELAKSKNVTPKEIVIAKDALAPIVNPANKVDNLTVQQLSDIYTGKITNWSEVGGDKGPIAVVSRDSSSGTFESWQELVVGKDNKVTPDALLQASSGAVLQAVSKNKYAISYDGLGYINTTIKALKVNGVAPSAKTALDKTYPVSRDLYLYVNGEPAGEVKAFIDFILSAEGQKLVADAGFVPLK